MRTIVGLACVALFGAAGCASTSEMEQREAMKHDYRAQRAASVGDYERAAAEQRAGRIERARAARHAYEEGEEYAPAPPPPPPLNPPPPAY